MSAAGAIMTLVEIQGLLGHADPHTTDGYIGRTRALQPALPTAWPALIAQTRQMPRPGRNVMAEDPSRGTPALLVVGAVLETAAEALASEPAARANLKVYSGEHLAAIFLTGLFGRTPSRFDDDGGPDLVFDSYDQPWFLFASPAAFEIKSLPGACRQTASPLAGLGPAKPTGLSQVWRGLVRLLVLLAG
jgi:hypothetical protein